MKNLFFLLVVIVFASCSDKTPATVESYHYMLIRDSTGHIDTLMPNPKMTAESAEGTR